MSLHNIPKHLKELKVMAQKTERRQAEYPNSAEQIWRDCEAYRMIDRRFTLMEGYRPLSAPGREEHKKLVTGLFEELEAIEAKYPFIDPKLSQNWSKRPISYYRYGKSARRKD